MTSRDDTVGSGRGMLAAGCSYLIWGVLPVYWKLLDQVDSLYILAHRMFWSLLVTVLLLLLLGKLTGFRALFADRRIVAGSAFSGMLLGVNWFIYIWAVNSGHIVEASLGYYINPLVTVVLAVLVLRERLRLGQIGALALAVCGVVYLTVVYGRFPWIALALAMTFAVYGLLHKTTRVAPLEGLFLETLVFLIPAGVLIFCNEWSGTGVFFSGGWQRAALLAATGVITTVPLLLFAYAAHSIRLSLLGVLQYLAPTLNLLIGVLVYQEDFPWSRAVGFFLVWGALLVFLGESLLNRVRLKKARLSR